ncbi:hypothetical protein FBQ97_18880 [Acidobacteria bacterium ACD]|nr:hypothetical protein [Acidobacteria bacterium ACD]
MTRGHFRLFAIVVGLLGCAAASYFLWKFHQQPLKPSWMEVSMALPLDSAKDRAEVYVAREPMEKLIAEERLLVVMEGNPRPVVANDVGLRFNNRDQNRVEQTKLMLLLAAGAGGGLVLFLVGLFTPMIGAFKGYVDLNLPSQPEG